MEVLLILLLIEMRHLHNAITHYYIAQSKQYLDHSFSMINSTTTVTA